MKFRTQIIASLTTRVASSPLPMADTTTAATGNNEGQASEAGNKNFYYPGYGRGFGFPGYGYPGGYFPGGYW